MLLQDKENGTLIEIKDVETLFNPSESRILGRDQAGQEEQELTDYDKANLVFPSGEELPRCWMDANYREVK
jgi:hypothetical protein